MIAKISNTTGLVAESMMGRYVDGIVNGQPSANRCEFLRSSQKDTLIDGLMTMVGYEAKFHALFFD